MLLFNHKALLGTPDLKMVCASVRRHQAFGEVSTFPTQLISCLREGPRPSASICLDKNRPVL